MVPHKVLMFGQFRMALGEKGVPYEHIPCAPHSEEINKRHPWGKIPAFEHDGTNVFESQAILRYIDETFEGPKLIPSTTQERIEVDQWCSAICDYLYVHAVKKSGSSSLGVSPNGQ